MNKLVQSQTEELISVLAKAIESIAARLVDYEQTKTTDWIVEMKRAEEVVKYAHKLADDTLYYAMESGATGEEEGVSTLWEALDEISDLGHLNFLSSEELVSRMAKILSRVRGEDRSDEELRAYALRFLMGHNRHAPKYPGDAVRIASVLIPRGQNESDTTLTARTAECYLFCDERAFGRRLGNPRHRRDLKAQSRGGIKVRNGISFALSCGHDGVRRGGTLRRA